MKTVFFLDKEGNLARLGPKGKPASLAVAMQASWAKWRTLAAVLSVRDGRIPHDGGPGTCELCSLFLTSGIPRCYGCPIYKHTGRPYCIGTAYARYCKAQKDGNSEKALVAARAEVRFLKRVAKEAGVEL